MSILPSVIPTKVQENRSRRRDSSKVENYQPGSNFGIDYDERWEPLNDRLFVRRLPDPAEHFRILTLIDSAKSTTNHGIVLKLGPGRRVKGVNGDTVRRPIDVKIGAEVIFGPYTDFEFYGEDVVLIGEQDIRGIVGLFCVNCGHIHGIKSDCIGRCARGEKSRSGEK